MECYTAGGDSYQSIKDALVAGQTFIPTETFDLEWVDLQLQLPLYIPTPVVLIYYADAHHEPSGDYLARDRYIVYREPGWTGFHRYRFSMQPYRLLKGVKYCITVGYYPLAGLPGMRWQYDAGDAEYPRGFRISSADAGATWSKHYDDDHMFAIFGTPPSPPPPPDPPIDNWLAPGIYYQPTHDGLKITLVTNVPCHLFMYWTLIPPRKHRIPRLRRGVQFSDILQYCFVAWHKNEQEEPGDTVIHTFVKEPWPICQTRYFIFRGNVDDQLSPSISAIFTKHRIETEILTQFGPVDGSLSNRHVQYSHVAWPRCHDNPTGTIPGSYGPPFFTIFAGERLNASYFLYRGMLFFPTHGIPPTAQIKYATLDIFCWEHKRTSSAGFPYLCITQGVQDDPVIPANYGDQLPYTLIGGQKDFSTFIDGVFNEITLNESGLGFINPGGWTKLCLRGQQDILDRPPPLGTNWIKFYSSQKGVGYRPRLTVWYWIPPGPPPVWAWHEPWGATLTENHPWVELWFPNDTHTSLDDGLMTIHNEYQETANIETSVDPAPISLIDPSLLNLHLHYHSPDPTYNPAHGWLSYLFRTKKGDETYTIEAAVAHGTDWGDFGSYEYILPDYYAFDLGQGPDVIDFTALWIEARIKSGANPNPSGWTLDYIRIINEQALPTDIQTHTNDYISFEYH